MVDLTPSSPEEFIKAGATPAQAAILHEQHEALAGRRGPGARAAGPSAAVLQALERSPEANARQQGAIAASALERAPAAAPPPPRSTVTPAQAAAALEAHTNEQLRAQLDHDFAPPADPSHYNFPPPPGRDLSDEEFQQELGIKAAFHAEGLPKFLGENIANVSVERVNALERMTTKEGQALIDSTEASLRRMWGRDYDSNSAKLGSFLKQMSNRHPGLGLGADVRLSDGRDVALLDLLDPLTINSLLEFAKHRATRR